MNTENFFIFTCNGQEKICNMTKDSFIQYVKKSTKESDTIITDITCCDIPEISQDVLDFLSKDSVFQYEQCITLVSSDNVHFKISRSKACFSEFIKATLEARDQIQDLNFESIENKKTNVVSFSNAREQIEKMTNEELVGILQNSINVKDTTNLKKESFLKIITEIKETEIKKLCQDTLNIIVQELKRLEITSNMLEIIVKFMEFKSTNKDKFLPFTHISDLDTSIDSNRKFVTDMAQICQFLLL